MVREACTVRGSIGLGVDSRPKGVDVRLDEASGLVLEIINSVAPVDQCSGYTGALYDSTTLYVRGDGVERTTDVGGKDVKDVSVCVCRTESDERSYIEREND